MDLVIKNISSKGDAKFFQELAKRLGLKTAELIAKDIKKPSYDTSKEAIVSNLKIGFKEMQLIKKGKLKTTSLNDFLNEL